MAMSPGTKKWSTLASWSDEDVYSYFRNTMRQPPEHARNSLVAVRRSYDRRGVRYFSGEMPSYKDAFSALSQDVRDNILRDINVRGNILRDISSAEPTPQETHKAEPTPVFVPPQETRKAEPTPVFVPPLDLPAADPAMKPLAAMIAPHLADLLATSIQNAVRASHEALAANQVTRLAVVSNGEPPRVIEGLHHEAASKVISLVGAGANVMLVGPAGCGKTSIASSVAKAFQRPLTVISCSAGMSEAQLLGRLLPLGEGGAFRYVESPFVRAYSTGGVILLDELDAADSNLLLVINAALANGFITVEARASSNLDTRVVRHPDTLIIAAANTWGHGADSQYVGRAALDAATLDRFYRLAIDYDHALERAIGSPEAVAYVQILRKKAREAKLKRVVSTRMIGRLDAGVRAGLTLKQACEDELAAWSPDERAKVA